jgi:hypothetical protein
VRKNPFENVLPRLLTIKQTASYWGVSPNSFRNSTRDQLSETTPLRLALDAPTNARSRHLA